MKIIVIRMYLFCKNKVTSLHYSNKLTKQDLSSAHWVIKLIYATFQPTEPPNYQLAIINSHIFHEFHEFDEFRIFASLFLNKNQNVVVGSNHNQSKRNNNLKNIFQLYFESQKSNISLSNTYAIFGHVNNFWKKKNGKNSFEIKRTIFFGPWQSNSSWVFGQQLEALGWHFMLVVFFIWSRCLRLCWQLHLIRLIRFNSMNFTNFMLDDKIKAKAKYTQSRHQHELLQRINA